MARPRLLRNCLGRFRHVEASPAGPPFDVDSAGSVRTDLASSFRAAEQFLKNRQVLQDFTTNGSDTSC